MPTATRTIARFTLSSTDKTTWSTVGSKTWSPDFIGAGVLAGSTINSATLDIYVSVNKSSSSGYIYIKDTDSGKRVAITNARSASYDVSSLFSGINWSSSYDKFVFTYQVTAGVGSGEADVRGYTAAATIKMTLNYTLPYTSCTAPTSVTAADTNVAPGATVRVSWSGASGGTNNAIKSYTLYRSTDDSTYTVLKSGITNTYYDVTSPTTNGATYYYKVKTVGNVSGYDSGMSSKKATIRTSFTAPSVSAVKIDDSTSTVYKLAGTSVTLSWSGANGTNNPITKYIVKQGATVLGDTTSTSYSVTAPAAGNQLTFSVTPIGTYSNGSAVSSPTLAAYSNPTAPTSVRISIGGESVESVEVGKQEAVTLVWSGATAGTANAITGYKVYRATSLSGTYSLLTSVDATVTSVVVTSSSTNDGYYYYKVQTVCVYSSSSPSSVYARIRSIWNAPTVTSISLSQQIVAPGSQSILNFQVASGRNNPVSSIEVYQGSALLATVSASTTTYTVTSGGAAGDQVSFKIKPIGQETTPESSFSDEVVLKSYGNVTAPSSIAVSNPTPDAGTNVTLSWSGAQAGSFNEIVSYDVYRSTSASGGYSLLASNVTGTSLLVAAPVNMGSSYYYKVSTDGRYSNSAISSNYAVVTSKVYTAPQAPTAMMSPSIAGVGDEPILSWTVAVDGTNNPVTGYRVFRSTSQSGTFTQLGSDLPATVRSLSVDAPSEMGASYYYRVYALASRSGYNISPPSNTVSLTKMNQGKCGIPPDFRAAATLVNPNETITLTWGESTPGTNNSVARYDVWRDAGNGWSSVASRQPNERTYTDTAGASGTVRRYRVIAISSVSSDFNSDYTQIVTVTSNSPPGSITGLVEQPLKIFESTPIALSWSAASDPDGNVSRYEIEIRTRESASSEWSSWSYYTNVTTASANLLPTLDRGHQCQFRIRAVDALGLTSGYVETSIYSRDEIPNAPVIVLPADNAVTYDAKPYMIVQAEIQSSGNFKVLEMAIDNGSWVRINPAGRVAQGYAVRCPSEISSGVLHYFQLRVMDSLGVASNVVSVHIRRSSITWERQISRGTIISKAGSMFVEDDLILLYGSYSGDTLIVDNGEWDDGRLIIGGDGGISHQEEIAQMYMYVNSGLSYYNLGTLTVPAAVGEDYESASSNNIGMFAAWGDQMSALYNAMKSIYTLLGLTAPAVSISSGMMPTAIIINTLRTMIENM